MTVQITVGFYDPPTDPAAFPGEWGSVRIVVDGKPLTKYRDHEQWERWGPHFDADGEELDWPKAEYVGEDIGTALGALHDAFVRFQSEDVERYEEVPAEIRDPSTRSVVVLSFVDGERARIAFQPIRESDYDGHYVDNSLLGYIVDPDELCRELVGCYREWQRYVDNAYPEHGNAREGFIDEFHEASDEKIAELGQFVD